MGNKKAIYWEGIGISMNSERQPRARLVDCNPIKNKISRNAYTKMTVKDVAQHPNQAKLTQKGKIKLEKLLKNFEDLSMDEWDCMTT